MVLELTFQRATVHPVHDTKRLEDGKDLNDALLDFFVKLGQALIPKGPPPVAYLGSHFYDVLRRDGAKDGFDGHKNVANWAKRRLGKAGLFAPGVGALAVPVNETLINSSYEGSQESHEKHWWLAILLNPGAGTHAGEERDFSLLCLDSFVRAETKFDPPVRALKGGNLEGYPVEVTGLARIGFNIKVMFRNDGDGSNGGLSEPHKSQLRAGGRVFPNTETELRGRNFGGDGREAHLDGALNFRLDRRGAAKTVGQYNLEFGDPSDAYEPQLKLRMGEKPTPFQAKVATFLGGYLQEERGQCYGSDKDNGNGRDASVLRSIESSICLPGVPQQETSHDCGFFIMEMILRLLSLPPKALRELATASAVEIAMLPWPSQSQILRRKAMLREAVEILFSAARKYGTGDVEEMMKLDPDLKDTLRSTLTEGAPSFEHGFERWAAGDWDLSPSVSRSRSRKRRVAPPPKERTRSKARSGSSGSGGRSRNKKNKKGRRSSSRESSRSKKRRRRRSASRSSTRSRRSSSSRSSVRKSAKGGEAGKAEQAPPAQLPSFSQQDLDLLGPGALRKLCVQRGVLPSGIVEKGDLVKALQPFAVAPAAAAAARQPKAASPAAPAPAAKAPATVFSRSDLDRMSVKELRNICVQKGCLPPPPLEKGDMVRALARFAGPG